MRQVAVGPHALRAEIALVQRVALLHGVVARRLLDWCDNWRRFGGGGRWGCHAGQGLGRRGIAVLEECILLGRDYGDGCWLWFRRGLIYAHGSADGRGRRALRFRDLLAALATGTQGQDPCDSDDGQDPNVSG